MIDACTDRSGRGSYGQAVQPAEGPVSAAGLTKAELIDYYARIAPVMLPHLAGRPLSFERYPDGIAAEGFMQKNASDYFPNWIRRARLAKQDGVVAHVVAEDAPTLDLSGQSGLHHLPCLAVAH